jgi:ketosteroid isomerase-like protein
MTNQEIKARIQNAFEALSSGNPQPYLDLFADDVSFRVTGSTRWSGTYRGKERLVNELLRPVSRCLQGKFNATVGRVVVEGDLVVMETKGENNTAKNGKPYNNEYCWVCRVKDGKFAEVTEYADTELFTSALVGEAPEVVS